MQPSLFNKLCILLLLSLFFSCSRHTPLPKETYHEFVYTFKQTYSEDSIFFHLKNPLMCPLNVQLVKDSLNPSLRQQFGLVTLREMQDTIIGILHPDINLNAKVNYRVRYGDINKKIEKNILALPFPAQKEYKIIQGYKGKYSHNGLYSQYAIDFNLKTGDTITSADNGYVVGLIEDYKHHGTRKDWRNNDKSNFITIYHPHSGLFTQYVHLNYKGSLVKLGDYVHRKQPIGISGMTGYTDTPHLHFNVKYPDAEYGLISTDIVFENSINGKDLYKNKRVK